MRKSLFIALLAAALITACKSFTPQTPPEHVDYLMELAEHPEYLDGTDYLCPTGHVDLTPAPAGYKPFYISHYGRHGARYAWQSDIYKRLHKVLGKAEEEDNLTDLGKDWRARFEQLYPDVKYRVGDLSRKGFQQQQELAHRMYCNFPQVFRAESHVRAWTSTSTRCVMTMSAFCLGLQKEDPKLDIFEYFGKFFLPAILPLDGSNPFRNNDYQVTPVPFEETWEQYIERTLDYGAILDRLFIDKDKALEPKEQWDFVSYLYFFAAGMASLDTDLVFTDIFTPEERIALWKIDNFQFYWYAWETHLGYMPILEDIVAKADERIASGKKGADLRFGHDYTILPLMMILDLDGMGKEAQSADDIHNITRLQQVPMGANVHFVFYRSDANYEVLFKVLHNGVEATLPVETDKWPYYSWKAFKEHYGF